MAVNYPRALDVFRNFIEDAFNWLPRRINPDKKNKNSFFQTGARVDLPPVCRENEEDVNVSQNGGVIRILTIN